MTGISERDRANNAAHEQELRKRSELRIRDPYAFEAFTALERVVGSLASVLYTSVPPAQAGNHNAALKLGQETLRTLRAQWLEER